LNGKTALIEYQAHSTIPDTQMDNLDSTITINTQTGLLVASISKSRMTQKVSQGDTINIVHNYKIFRLESEQSKASDSLNLIKNTDLRPGGETEGEVTDSKLLLEKAMEYSLTMSPRLYMKSDETIDQNLYESYVKNANQGLAEEYFLAYLKEVEDPSKRARVYNKLGKLFIGGVRQEVTATGGLDLKKAVGYFTKVLEETPDAVNAVTLNARGGMLSDPGLSKEEMFQRRMDYYQWLCSIDEQKITESNPSASKTSLDSFEKLIASQRETVASNLVQNAVDIGRITAQRNDRYGEIEPDYLLELIERFPGTDIAQKAKEKNDNLPN
ncbi:MAG: hypothetical protein ACYSUT_10945, partial [Planctomycetota bacterium]